MPPFLLIVALVLVASVASSAIALITAGYLDRLNSEREAVRQPDYWDVEPWICGRPSVGCDR